MSSTAALHSSRPRVEGDREREILTAALGVLAEVGYDRMTMDAVALAARASKATLYRRWQSKATLVI
ncbi:MAG: helix-turn-helix domain-containing protein, partial [Phycicoccus sp.]